MLKISLKREKTNIKKLKIFNPMGLRFLKINVIFVIGDLENPKTIFLRKKFFLENFWRLAARPGGGAQIEKFLHGEAPRGKWNPFMGFLCKKNFKKI